MYLKKKHTLSLVVLASCGNMPLNIPTLILNGENADGTDPYTESIVASIASQFPQSQVVQLETEGKPERKTTILNPRGNIVDDVLDMSLKETTQNNDSNSIHYFTKNIGEDVFAYFVWKGILFLGTVENGDFILKEIYFPLKDGSYAQITVSYKEDFIIFTYESNVIYVNTQDETTPIDLTRSHADLKAFKLLLQKIEKIETLQILKYFFVFFANQNKPEIVFSYNHSIETFRNALNIEYIENSISVFFVDSQPVLIFKFRGEYFAIIIGAPRNDLIQIIKDRGCKFYCLAEGDPYFIMLIISDTLSEKNLPKDNKNLWPRIIKCITASNHTIQKSK